MICVCNDNVATKMTCVKNGVLIVDSKEAPYSCRDGDLFECKNCGNKVINNFGCGYFLKEENMVAAKENLEVFYIGNESD